MAEHPIAWSIFGGAGAGDLDLGRAECLAAIVYLQVGVDLVERVPAALAELEAEYAAATTEATREGLQIIATAVMRREADAFRILSGLQR